MQLTRNERLALEFLANGPDTPGLVNSGEVAAAHLVFGDLVKRGLASKIIGEDSPTYSITGDGLAALAAPTIP